MAKEMLWPEGKYRCSQEVWSPSVLSGGERSTSIFSWFQLQKLRNFSNILQKAGVKREQLPSCSNFLLAFVDGWRWIHCQGDIPGEEEHMSAKPSDLLGPPPGGKQRGP